MGRQQLVDDLERIVLAGVALTTLALAESALGRELTFSQWRTLLVVGATPDGATISRVANRVGTSLPATSRQLHRLAARGLLELGPDARDRRATLARLSPAGHQARDTVLARRREAIAMAVDQAVIEDLDRDGLTRLAERLTSVADRDARSRAARSSPGPELGEAS